MGGVKNLVIQLIEAFGGFRFLQWRNRKTPLVLMYHRIIDDPRLNGISPEIFEQQIAYIAKRFRVVPINQLLDELHTDRIEPFTLALTFDDGHFDFYEFAWPILKKYNLPASLYVTTGFVDGTTWLWPDLLKYALMNSNNSPLQVPDLGEVSTHQKDFYESWHKLGDYCLTLEANKRMELLLNLLAQLQIPVPAKPLVPFSAVTWEQLNEMKIAGLDVGSHTITHPILSKLPQDILYNELKGSAEAIQENLGGAPTGICYPNGRPEDINEGVIKAAQSVGYTYGLMGRNMELNKHQLFKVGRQAASQNFEYFKWAISRRALDIAKTYLS